MSVAYEGIFNNKKWTGTPGSWSEVSASKLGLETGILTEMFCGFPQSFPINAEIQLKLVKWIMYETLVYKNKISYGGI